MLVDRGQPGRAGGAGGKGRLTGEAVPDPDSRSRARGCAERGDGTSEDLVGYAPLAFLACRLVVRPLVEEVGAEGELVPDLDVEVLASDHGARLPHDRPHVEEPSGERFLEAGVWAPVRQPWRAERLVAERGRRVGACVETLRQRLRERGRSVRGDSCEEHARRLVPRAVDPAAARDDLRRAGGRQAYAGGSRLGRLGEVGPETPHRTGNALVGVEQDERPDAVARQSADQRPQALLVAQPGGVVVVSSGPSRSRCGRAGSRFARACGR